MGKDRDGSAAAMSPAGHQYDETMRYQPLPLPAHAEGGLTIRDQGVTNLEGGRIKYALGREDKVHGASLETDHSKDPEYFTDRGTHGRVASFTKRMNGVWADMP